MLLTMACSKSDSSGLLDAKVNETRNVVVCDRASFLSGEQIISSKGTSRVFVAASIMCVSRALALSEINMFVAIMLRMAVDKYFKIVSHTVFLFY